MNIYIIYVCGGIYDPQCIWNISNEDDYLKRNDNTLSICSVTKKKEPSILIRFPLRLCRALKDTLNLNKRKEDTLIHLQSYRACIEHKPLVSLRISIIVKITKPNFTVLMVLFN